MRRLGSTGVESEVRPGVYQLAWTSGRHPLVVDDLHRRHRRRRERRQVGGGGVRRAPAPGVFAPGIAQRHGVEHQDPAQGELRQGRAGGHERPQALDRLEARRS